MLQEFQKDSDIWSSGVSLSHPNPGRPRGRAGFHTWLPEEASKAETKSSPIRISFLSNWGTLRFQAQSVAPFGFHLK